MLIYILYSRCIAFTCTHSFEYADLDRDGTIDWRELCTHAFPELHTAAAQPSNDVADDVVDDVIYPSKLPKISTMTTDSSSSSSSSSRSVEGESKQEHIV
jgi:hypothetical protein